MVKVFEPYPPPLQALGHVISSRSGTRPLNPTPPLQALGHIISAQEWYKKADELAGAEVAGLYYTRLKSSAGARPATSMKDAVPASRGGGTWWGAGGHGSVLCALRVLCRIYLPFSQNIPPIQLEYTSHSSVIST